MEKLNLLLGITGLALGFISAYSQIKAFASRVLHIGSSAADRLRDREEERANFYLRNPTAFLAYVTRSFVLFLAIFFMIGIFRPQTLLGLGMPLWLAYALYFLVPAGAGLILGFLASMCATVMQTARRNEARTDSSS